MHQNKNTACQNKKHSGFKTKPQKLCVFWEIAQEKQHRVYNSKGNLPLPFFFLHLQIQVSKRLDIFIIHDRVYNMQRNNFFHI